MPHQVFISHSAEDKDVADALCNALENNGLSCWIAPRDILPGASWGAAIIDAITQCSVMVFVFSSHSNSSQHVMRELDCAVKRGKTIIPFRTEAVLPSETIEYFVATAQWFDAIPEPTKEHYDHLAEMLSSMLAASDEAELSAAAGTDELKPTASLQWAGTQFQPSAAPQEPAPKTEHERKLVAAEELFDKGQRARCTRRCGTILTGALRQVISDMVHSLSSQETRSQIEEIQRAAGGKGSLQSLGLAQLVGMFTHPVVFDELRKHLTSNLSKARQIDWDQVLSWHEAAGDPGASSLLTDDDVMQMLYWTKLFLYDAELAGAAPKVERASGEVVHPEKCPCCEEAISGDWNYCPYCGAVLSVTCEGCDRVLAPDFRICPYCETPVRLRGAHEADSAERARQEYHVLCAGAYLDGVVNLRERGLLEKKRLELGLSAEAAEEIERDCAPEHIVEYSRLIEGVLVDGVISERERKFLQQKAEQLGVDPWVAEQVEKVALAMNRSGAGDEAEEA